MIVEIFLLSLYFYFVFYIINYSKIFSEVNHYLAVVELDRKLSRKQGIIDILLYIKKCPLCLSFWVGSALTLFSLIPVTFVIPVSTLCLIYNSIVVKS